MSMRSLLSSSAKAALRSYARSAASTGAVHAAKAATASTSSSSTPSFMSKAMGHAFKSAACSPAGSSAFSTFSSLKNSSMPAMSLLASSMLKSKAAAAPAYSHAAPPSVTTSLISNNSAVQSAAGGAGGVSSTEMADEDEDNVSCPPRKKHKGIIAQDSRCVPPDKARPFSHISSIITTTSISASAMLAGTCSTRCYITPQHGCSASAASGSIASSGPGKRSSAATYSSSGTAAVAAAAAARAGAGGKALHSGSSSHSMHSTRQQATAGPAVHAVHADDTTHDDSNSSGASQDAARNVYILKESERHQPPVLSSADAAFLWQRAEQLASMGVLPRARVGRSGPSAAWLAGVGDQLAAHEVVRVTVPANSPVDAGFVGWLLQATQDCALVKAKGNTLTLFRDASLPRPPSTRSEFRASVHPHYPDANQQQQPSVQASNRRSSSSKAAAAAAAAPTPAAIHRHPMSSSRAAAVAAMSSAKQGTPTGSPAGATSAAAQHVYHQRQQQGAMNSLHNKNNSRMAVAAAGDAHGRSGDGAGLPQEVVAKVSVSAGLLRHRRLALTRSPGLRARLRFRITAMQEQLAAGAASR